MPDAASPAGVKGSCEETLDLEALEELASVARGSGSGFVEEAVATYLSETPIQISVIREALAREDTQALNLESHSLKSSSAALGARNMRKFSAELERRTEAGTLEGADALLRRLEEEFELVKSALESGPWKGLGIGVSTAGSPLGASEEPE